MSILRSQPPMLLLILSELVVSVRSASFSLQVAKLQSECGVLYTVVAGDGCWAITNSAAITQAQLEALNPTLDCSTMGAGEGLCLSLPCSKTYQVVSGDWCAKIQDEQAISAADLVSLNPGFDCADLFAGQRLCTAASITPPSEPTPQPPVIELPADPVPTIVCGSQVAVSEGDTCYDLSVKHGIQLSQFTAMNGNLDCAKLQAGDLACLLAACDEIYKVQSGDWCSKIEGDFSLASGKLLELNPGLSCAALSADQTLCVMPAVEVVEEKDIPMFSPGKLHPVFSPGTEIRKSPLTTFLNTEDLRQTFTGDMIFQLPSSHKSTFARADINKDGHLDISEIRRHVATNPSMGKGVEGFANTEAMIQQIMTSSDTDGDGKITEDEFMAAVVQAQATVTETELVIAEHKALGKTTRAIHLLPLAIIGIIAALTITFFAVLMDQMEKKSRQTAGDLLDYIDISFWDRGQDPEPKCAAYMYYSTSCAALGHHWSSDCSEGGEKVYDDSCRGLFKDGAKACGFLGCSSLCYKVNTQGCDCDALNYSAEEGSKYSDTPFGTSYETSMAGCRKKCSNLKGCVGFSISEGRDDLELDCKIYKTMNSKQSGEQVSSFKIVGQPVGSTTNPICPIVPVGYSPRPFATMLKDHGVGAFRSYAYAVKHAIIGRREEDTEVLLKKRQASTCPWPKRSKTEERAPEMDAYLVKRDRTLARRAPDRVDLRYTYGTTIKSQGTTNTCASFATSSLVEGTVKRKYSRVGVTKDISALWIHGCRSGSSTIYGNYFRDISRWVGDSYLATEECMPWSATRPTCSPNNCAASQYGSLPYITNTYPYQTSVASMALGYTGDIEEIKTHLADTGPVWMSFSINDAFEAYATAIATTRQETVFYDGLYPYLCGYGPHAMLVVGYGHYTRPVDPADPCAIRLPRLYWIVQNSWGSRWGINGHSFIELGSLANTHGYEPAYGIKVNEGTQWVSSSLPVS